MTWRTWTARSQRPGAPSTQGRGVDLVGERIAVLTRFRDLVAEHHEEYAVLITEQVGCPITQARNIQVPAPMAVLEAMSGR